MVLTTFIDSSLGDLLDYLQYLPIEEQTKAMEVKLVFGLQSVGRLVEWKYKDKLMEIEHENNML